MHHSGQETSVVLQELNVLGGEVYDAFLQNSCYECVCIFIVTTLS